MKATAVRDNPSFIVAQLRHEKHQEIKRRLRHLAGKARDKAKAVSR